ncbi:MAG: alkaline phosphatase family protein [Thaumarchaeota archaeon]|nr:alkaline phosphatase family protein [Nitrososphaerota archaeon]
MKTTHGSDFFALGSFLILGLLFLGLFVTPSFASMPTPKIQHVIIIMMENESYRAIFGTPNGTYEQQLAQKYSSAGNYYAITSQASLPNYLGILGGYYFHFKNTNNDPTKTNGINAFNLVDLLEAKGLTWKSYNQDIPKPCYQKDFGPSNYTVHHDPFVYFNDIRHNDKKCDNVVGFDQLFTALRENNLPNFSFIVPNDFNNSHDTGPAFGDHWLSSFVPLIIHSPSFSSTVLFIIYDEPSGNNHHGFGTGKYSVHGGRVPLILVSPFANMGFRSPDLYSPYSLLATVEKIFGLGTLGRGDATTTSMNDLFSK